MPGLPDNSAWCRPGWRRSASCPNPCLAVSRDEAADDRVSRSWRQTAAKKPAGLPTPPPCHWKRGPSRRLTRVKGAGPGRSGTTPSTRARLRGAGAHRPADVQVPRQRRAPAAPVGVQSHVPDREQTLGNKARDILGAPGRPPTHPHSSWKPRGRGRRLCRHSPGPGSQPRTRSPVTPGGPGLRWRAGRLRGHGHSEYHRTSLTPLHVTQPLPKRGWAPTPTVAQAGQMYWEDRSLAWRPVHSTASPGTYRSREPDPGLCSALFVAERPPPPPHSQHTASAGPRGPSLIRNHYLRTRLNRQQVTAASPSAPEKS